MRKRLIALSIVAMTALLINGCAVSKKGGTSFEDITGKTLVVDTDEWHEDCEKLAAGETLNLAFKSSQPGLYEIFYRMKNVKYDYKDQTLADGFRGTINVQDEAIYCFMFLNRNPEPVTLTYDMSIEEK